MALLIDLNTNPETNISNPSTAHTNTYMDFLEEENQSYMQPN